MPPPRHDNPGRTALLRNITGWLSHGPGYANYMWSRVLQEESTKPMDYEANLRALLLGVKELNRRRRAARQPVVKPIWVEAPPQHFAHSLHPHETPQPPLREAKALPRLRAPRARKNTSAVVISNATRAASRATATNTTATTSSAATLSRRLSTDPELDAPVAANETQPLHLAESSGDGNSAGESKSSNDSGGGGLGLGAELALSAKHQNGCAVLPLSFISCQERMGPYTTPALWDGYTRFCSFWKERASLTPVEMTLSCHEALRDWRNLLAAPLLAAHGIPVVPLAAALSSRGDLHAGNESNRKEGTGLDCTHYCEPSEATVQMASATLSMAAAAVLS